MTCIYGSRKLRLVNPPRRYLNQTPVPGQAILPYIAESYLDPQPPPPGNLVALPITTGAASLGSPALGQTHALAAAGLTTGPSSAGSPALGQQHTLTAQALATGAATLGSPSLTSGSTSLTASPITTGAASIGAPAFSQTHTLGAVGISAGPASVGTTTLGQTHVFAAAPLSLGPASLGAPLLGQTHILGASGLACGLPEIGTPAFDSRPYPPPIQRSVSFTVTSVGDIALAVTDHGELVLSARSSLALAPAAPTQGDLALVAIMEASC